MKARKKEIRVSSHLNINLDLKEALIELSEESDIAMSRLIDQAIKLLLAKHNRPIPGEEKSA